MTDSSSINRIRRARTSLGLPTAATVEAAPVVTTPEPREPRILAMPELPKAYWFGLVSGGSLSQVPVFCIERSVRDVAIDKLESVWRELVRRHEMLRSIVTPEGTFAILDDVDGPMIAVSDLSALSTEDAEREVDRHHDEMLARTRPLDRAPLFEVRALQLPDGSTRMLFAFCVFIFDAASWFMLEREANVLYRDPDATLPPPARSYADHVAAKAAVDPAELARATAYWDERLATLPRGPALPARRTATAKRWYHSQFKLSAQHAAGLKATARALGLSNHSLVTSAFAEAISTWSKSRHFVLTLLVQSKRPAEYAGVFGNFGATLALEVDFRGARSFRQRARELHRRFLLDLEHRARSGIHVGRELNRMSGRPPMAMFPVAFSSVWSTGDPRVSEEPSCLGSYVRRQLRVPDVTIDVGVAEHADGQIVCNIDAREDLFPDGMLVDLEQAFGQLLRDLAANPDVADRLRPLAAPPRDLALVSEMNATEAPQDTRLLHELFLEQAARWPQATAVIAADRTLTYGELDRLSAALAHRLRGLGVEGQRVAVAMVRGWQQAVAVLAIHRAGAAYVPVDIALVPHERMLHIFAHAGVRVAVTQPDAAAAIDWPAETTILTVETTPASDAPAPEVSWPRPRLEDVAYIIYTSGSTGLPKGVTIDHRGAVNTVVDINKRFGIDARDRVLALSSLGFDLSVWDIFGTFAVGGVLVMPLATERPDPAEWSRTASAHGVTVWNSVPKLLEITLESIGERRELWPSTLRLAMLSGDWIPTSLPARVRAMSPSIELISLGGATEASIWSNYFKIGEVHPSWPSIPYGRPLTNQTLHILDDALTPRPVWVTGELYIGGIGLATCYWGDEDKTKASFIIQPETGARLYRTGDLGRYLPDGNIEFLGREDSQIKIRGYRVELGEIEAVISKLPGIRETYVLAREAATQRALERRRRATDGTRLPAERGGDKQLIAYIIPEPNQRIDEADVRARVAEKLPDYMVPTFFVVLNATEIPRSANGKVDRRALPQPDQRQPEQRTEERRAPSDAIEASLLALFARVLGVDEVGPDDSFFELGGDSVMLVRALSQIRQEHSREITVATFALDPRVSSLAALLRAAPGGPNQERSLLTLRTEGTKRPLFLVHPVGGSGLVYLTLSQYLPADRPLYALQSRGLESDAAPLATIEEMATAYIAEMRRVQPEGPYLVGGWSLGGLISFEIARQLAGQASVLMVDTWAPNGASRTETVNDDTLIEWFRRDIVGISGMSRPSRDGGAASSSMRRQYAVYSANVRAARAYMPEKTGCRLALIRANTVANPFASHPALRNPRIEDHSLGWSALCERPFEVRAVDGDHYSIFSSNYIEGLARSIEEMVGLLELR